MVRLRDIAEKVGVSRMTVSLALRGNPRVAAETREKVRKIAKEMGYKPNPQISTLMSEVAKTHYVDSGEHLAFLTSHTTEQGWKKQEHIVNYFEGAHERASEYGYVLEPLWIHDPRSSPQKMVKMMWSRGIKGALIAPLGPKAVIDNRRTLDFDWNRFAVVEMDETLDTPKLICARHNHFNGMLLLLHEMESLGYRRIGLTMSRITESRTRHRWYSSYMFWSHVRGMEDDLPILFYDELDASITEKWIRKYRLDAVASVEDVLAEQLVARGLNIPGDIGFCVLDRPDKVEGYPLSGISQNSRLIGQSATDILMGLVRRGELGVPNHPSQWICNGSWIAGSSTCRVGKPLDQHPLYNRSLEL